MRELQPLHLFTRPDEPVFPDCVGCRFRDLTWAQYAGLQWRRGKVTCPVCVVLAVEAGAVFEELRRRSPETVPEALLYRT